MSNTDDFSAIGADAKRLSPPESGDARAHEEKILLENERRGVQTRIHRIVRYFLYFGSFLLAALIFIRFWHIGAPECWRWLSNEDVQGMDKMLFSSAFGGVVITYLKDVLTPKK